MCMCLQMCLNDVGWVLSFFYGIYEGTMSTLRYATLKEELKCKREPGNPHNTHALL